MKILYIITIPDWGGAQKYVFDETQNEIRTGNEVIVCSGAPAGFSNINLLRVVEYKNIKTHQFSNLAREISIIKDILAILEIKKYIELEKPNRIHLNSSKAGILGSFAAALSNFKPEVYYTVHGWVFLEPMTGWRRKLYIYLEKLASRYRNRIIVLGEKEKQTASKYKISSEQKIEVRYHTLYNTYFATKSAARSLLNMPQNIKIIGTIANFFPAKALHNLIDAASQISSPDTIFGIIGDGPLRNELEQQINSLNLKDKVILFGEKECAMKYLSAFDIFVLPSVKEGAPFTILEAMAANLPIIATDVGSIPEMLRDYPNKTIIPPADIGALILAIKDKL